MKTIRWAALLILITTLVSVAQVQSSAQVTFSDVNNNDEYHNDAAAVLIELGFVANSEDIKKLTNNQYLETFAESIYQGLVQYYSAN